MLVSLVYSSMLLMLQRGDNPPPLIDGEEDNEGKDHDKYRPEPELGMSYYFCN